MTKFRKSLLIFGILVLLICTALGTFIVLSLTGSLKAEPIALEFTIGNLTREYNGEPQKASLEDEDCRDLVNMDGGYLIEGHEFDSVTFTGEQTDVGWCRIGLSLKVIDGNGYDVTDQYKIKVNEGVLFVTPTQVNIKVNATEVPYDGTAIDIGDDYTASGLAKGHSVSLKISDKWFAEKGKHVAGNTLNAGDLDLTIVDGNGRDVSYNYNTSLACRVNISERPLTIAPENVQKPYDGQALECSEGKIVTGSLAAGHYITYRCETADGMPAKLTDVGSLEIIAKAIIYDINGDDVSDNYVIGSKYGNITVTKANLTVSLKPIENEYGKPFSVTSDELCTIISTMNNLSLKFIDENYLNVNFAGRALGTAPYTLGVDDFEIFNGDENVTDKFNIIVNSSNMKITPREVKLVQDESLQLSTVYQGNFTFNKGLSLDGIAEKHSITSFTCESVSAGDAKPSKIVSLSLVDEYGNSALEYYNITNLSEFAVILNVEKKAITVYLTENLEIEARDGGINGIELAGYINCDVLDAENFTVVNTTYDQLGVNEVTFEWKDSENAEYVNNYQIEAGNAEFLLIRNYTATIDANTAQFKIYDAKPVIEEDLTFEKLGVNADNTTGFKFGSSNLLGLTEGGTYDAEVLFRKSEYERFTVTGKYVIEPFKVTVKIDTSAIYDGRRYEPHVSVLIVEGELNGVSYSVKSYTGKYTEEITEAGKKDIINVGDHTLKFDSVDLITSGGKSVNPDNVQVDLTASYVNVKITPRPLQIKLDTLTGTRKSIMMQTDADLINLVNVSNLADGETFKIEDENGDITGAFEVSFDGSSFDTSFVRIYRTTGNVTEDVTKNYLKLEAVVNGIVTVTD